MAGSYRHCVTGSGELRRGSFAGMIENLGDAYEAVEEMYGMIWFLAAGDPDRVQEAEENYDAGLVVSPGLES